MINRIIQFSLFVSVVFFATFSTTSYAQIGIGNFDPHPSSILDVRVINEDKGIIIPQVSLDNLNSDSSIAGNDTAEGLLIYNTNTSTGKGYYFWDKTNSTWRKVLTETDKKNVYTNNGTLNENRTVHQGSNFLQFSGNIGKNAVTLKRTNDGHETGIAFRNADDTYDSAIYMTGGAGSGLVLASGGASDDVTGISPTLTLQDNNSITLNQYNGNNFPSTNPAGIMAIDVNGNMLQMNSFDALAAFNKDWFEEGSNPPFPPFSIEANIYTLGNVGINIGQPNNPTKVPNAPLHIFENNGTVANPNDATVIIQHNNNGGEGTSSITFKSAVSNSDYAFLEFEDDGSGNGTTNENALLTLGNTNNGTYEDGINFSTTDGAVGINEPTPNADASLHLGQNDRGLLINKVTLADITDAATINGTEPDGLLVYNTTPAGTKPNDVIEGFYYWQVDRWKLIEYDRSPMQYYSYHIPQGAAPDLKAVKTDSTIVKSGKYAGSLDNNALIAMQPRPDEFTIKIVGTYLVKNSGTFNFTSNSDDGIRIYVDGSLILNQWSDSGDNNGSGSVNLAKGKHHFEFWFYENRGGEKFTFSWGANPDNNTGIIKTSQFTTK